MIFGKKVIVTMPAFRAKKTLKQTYEEIPHSIVDSVILVDDASHDGTAELARSLGINTVLHHEVNRGYGGNQKTCYSEALRQQADIVIMLHPDYQYAPALIEPLAVLIAKGSYDMVLGSRILGKSALEGGMPVYKYVANRCLTLFQNLILWEHLTEYHTGYRAYSRKLLESIPFQNNSDGFIFDNEFLCQSLYAGFKIGEISCPTRYFKDASSINFLNSVIYGLGVLSVSVQYRLHALGLINSKLFREITRIR